MDTSEGRASPSLIGRLAGGCEVKGISTPSDPSSPVVRQSGNCHQLGDVGPTAVDSYSVSPHDNRHIPRTGFSSAGLSSSLLGGGFVIPAPSMVSLQRFLPRDRTSVWSPVASNSLLVSGNGRPCHLHSHFTAVRRSNTVVA